MKEKRSVLFVCTGNICRSPTAEGIFRSLLKEQGLEKQIRVQSAGTHDYHVGEPPDERAQHHAKGRGYDLSSQRARRVERRDFAEHDLIVALDRGHLKILSRMCPPEHQAKLRLLVPGRDVPDPYYGGSEDFERVLDLLEAACRDLLAEMKSVTS